jgi:hypothetical protein
MSFKIDSLTTKCHVRAAAIRERGTYKYSKIIGFTYCWIGTKRGDGLSDMPLEEVERTRTCARSRKSYRLPCFNTEDGIKLRLNTKGHDTKKKHRTRDIVLFAETRDRNQAGEVTGPPCHAYCATYICASVCIKVSKKLQDCMILC